MIPLGSCRCRACRGACSMARDRRSKRPRWQQNPLSLSFILLAASLGDVQAFCASPLQQWPSIAGEQPLCQFWNAKRFPSKQTPLHCSAAGYTGSESRLSGSPHAQQPFIIENMASHAASLRECGFAVLDEHIIDAALIGSARQVCLLIE